MLPTVAIIGRTNVGKSTLFNRITRSRRAIVADEPGVTRDRLFGKAEFLEKPFILVDTGGFEDPHGEYIKEQMLEQTELGIQEADSIILVVDGLTGVLPADREVAEHLRRSGKPIFLVVNKLDEQRHDDERVADFYSLGFEKMYPLSAEHNQGVDELLEAVTADFAEREPEPEPTDAPEEDWADEEAAAEAASRQERPMRIAIVGRPNVGKSSLVNRLLGEERMVVHDMPGTTRDAIDSELEWEGRRYILVDTAGVRRKSRVTDRIEKFSVLKAFRAIEECDVAILVLDATIGVHEQDAKIAGMVVEEGRGIVIVFNKWDLPEEREKRIKELEENLKLEMKFLPDPQVVFVSAKTGQRATKILELAEQAGKENSKRIPTSEFNQLLLAATERHKPPMWANHPVKFYYAAQIGVRPPTFALQTNWPQGVHFSYQRFLENVIRENYGFKGAPIRLKFRQKGGMRKKRR
jgi:GTP-binding protein